jgi:hypothetical protein
MDVIAPTTSEIFWWESFHHLFGRDVEYTKTASSIINLNRIAIPFTPLVKHISVNVYNNFDVTFFFDWIMGSHVPLLVNDEIPKRKPIWEVENEDDNASSEEDLDVEYNPDLNEYDIMFPRQHPETSFSQDLKLASSPVHNQAMPYVYYFESYKSLIKYADTHSDANIFLSKVMQEVEAKMINFVTERGIVPLAMSMEETNKNTTPKQRKNTVVMGKKLTIISSHQHTQKRYCRKKSKAEIAARRSRQKKPVPKKNGCT